MIVLLLQVQDKENGPCNWRSASWSTGCLQEEGLLQLEGHGPLPGGRRNLCAEGEPSSTPISNRNLKITLTMTMNEVDVAASALLPKEWSWTCRCWWILYWSPGEVHALQWASFLPSGPHLKFSKWALFIHFFLAETCLRDNGERPGVCSPARWRPPHGEDERTHLSQVQTDRRGGANSHSRQSSPHLLTAPLPPPHRVKQLFRYDFLTKEDSMSDPFKALILSDCLGMYDWALANKFFLSKGVSESGWK